MSSNTSVTNVSSAGNHSRNRGVAGLAVKKGSKLVDLNGLCALCLSEAVDDAIKKANHQSINLKEALHPVFKDDPTMMDFVFLNKKISGSGGKDCSANPPLCGECKSKLEDILELKRSIDAIYNQIKGIRRSIQEKMLDVHSSKIEDINSKSSKTDEIDNARIIEKLTIFLEELAESRVGITYVYNAAEFLGRIWNITLPVPCVPVDSVKSKTKKNPPTSSPPAAPVSNEIPAVTRKSKSDLDSSVLPIAPKRKQTDPISSSIVLPKRSRKDGEGRGAENVSKKVHVECLEVIVIDSDDETNEIKIEEDDIKQEVELEGDPFNSEPEINDEEDAFPQSENEHSDLETGSTNGDDAAERINYGFGNDEDIEIKKETDDVDPSMENTENIRCKTKETTTETVAPAVINKIFAVIERKNNVVVLSKPDNTNTSIDLPAIRAMPVMPEIEDKPKKNKCIVEKGEDICEICNKKIRLTYLLERHLRDHVGDFLYKCHNDKCKMTFMCKYSTMLRYHMAKNPACRSDFGYSTAIKGEAVTCTICGEKCLMKRFATHLAGHETLEKPYKCPLCVEHFTFRDTLEWHLSDEHYYRKVRTQAIIAQDSPQVEDVIDCKRCGKRFAKKDNLVDHLVFVHLKGSNDGIICDICPSETQSEVITNPYTLREHYLKVHQIGKTFVCDECDALFYHIYSLNKHKRKVHEKKDLKPHKCGVCHDPPAEFCNTISLRRHNILVHGADPFVCQVCGEEFATSRSLSEHEREHLGEAPKFTCEICGKEFKRKHCFKTHQLFHSTERNFKCTQCTWSFKSNGTLQKHIRSVHLGIGNICKTCGRNFKCGHAFKKHLLIHTEEGRDCYTCHVCGFTFGNDRKYKTHMKTHDQQEVQLRRGLRARKKKSW